MLELYFEQQKGAIDVKISIPRHRSPPFRRHSHPLAFHIEHVHSVRMDSGAGGKFCPGSRS